MLTNTEISTLSELIRQLMQERTNPIMVTDIATRIHETPNAEEIWQQRRGEFDNRISLMIKALPGIRLVGTTEGGTGACFAQHTSLPITLNSNWIPWYNICQSDQAQPIRLPAVQSVSTVPGVPVRGFLSPAEKEQVILFIRNIIEESGGKVLASVAGARCLSDSRIVLLRSRFTNFSSMLNLLAPEIVRQREEGSGVDILVDGTHSNNTALYVSSATPPFATVDGYPVEIDL